MENQNDAAQQLYEQINALQESVISNENKAINLRKIFERLLKLQLGYDPNDISDNLFKMIDIYIKKTQNYNLQDVSHRLRKELNKWPHDTKEKLSDSMLLKYIAQLQNIIQAMTGVEYSIKGSNIKPFNLNELRLNKEQNDAVMSENKITLITAGPGTGKTYLLIGRILNELKENTGKKMLALAFTNKSANELRGRLDRLMFSTDLAKYRECVHVGTAHSFALHLIQEFYAVNKNAFPFTIIDTDEYNRIKAFCDMKDEESDDYLEKYDLLTFTGIIIKCLNMLQTNSEFLNYAANQWDEIIIDEAQDLNKSLYKILSLLRSEREDLKFFIVGDQRQNIFSFTGASISNLKYLPGNKTDVRELKLTHSYRCPESILSFVNQITFADCVNERLFNAIGNIGQKLKLKEFSTQEDEATWVASFVMTKKREGVNLKEIVSLFPNIYYLGEIAKAFNSYKIPFKAFGGTWHLNEDIRFLKHLLGSIYEKKNAYAYQQIKELLEKFRKPYLISDEGGDQLILDFINKKRYEIIDKSIGTGDILSEFILLVTSQNLFSDEVINNFQMLKTIIDNDLILNDYRKLRLSYTPSHSQLGQFFSRYKDDLKSEWYNDDDDFVFLSTIHAAKGLEWDNVIIPGMSQDIFPRYEQREEKKDNSLESERKKFFVACTRTKKNLYFTRPKRNKKGYEKEVSIFLRSLKLAEGE